jgi:hypothetical protein
MGHKIASIIKNSNINIIKTLGAALAAVTVALISSHLAGYVNSLVLVGAASVITALASEAYRMILSATTRTVAATARKTAQVIKDQPQDLEDTQEIPTVSDSQGDTDVTPNETTVLDTTSPKEAINPTPRASQDITKESPASEKAAAAIVSKMSTWVTRANPRTVKTCFRWAIMFLSMTLIAVGASYLMGGKDTERIVYRDVVKDSPASAAPSTLSSTTENTQGATSSGTPSAGSSQDNATPPSQAEQVTPTTEPDSGSKSITQQGTQDKENPHPGDSSSNSGASRQKQAPNTYTQQNQEQVNPDSQANRDGTSHQDNHKKQEDDNQESQANQDAGSGDQNPANQAGQGTEEVNNNTGD